MADFIVDRLKKTFTIVVSGFASDGGNFVEDLKTNVGKIKPSEYTLILDGETMKTFKPEVLPVLEKAYALYESFGFKQTFILNPHSITPKMQLRRIAKKCNFQAQFVDGKQEALKLASTM